VIQINLRSEGVEIKRRPLMEKIVLSKSRLLQNGTSAFCGNGLVDDINEQCDDKNTVSGDGCDSNCKL
jgi:cysteine-rich repeat protein